MGRGGRVGGCIYGEFVQARLLRLLRGGSGWGIDLKMVLASFSRSCLSIHAFSLANYL